MPRASVPERATDGLDLLTGPVAAEGVTSSSMTMWAGLVRAARPKQWAKNLLVFAAPAAAGVLVDAEPLLHTVIAFVAFCMVASGTYFLNDVRDLVADRAHPEKRYRPIALGVVPTRVAVATGAASLVTGFTLGATADIRFVGVLAVYVVLTASYTMWLKHVAVVDIALISAGFIIRAVAGGVVVDVPISQWFLIVTSFGSLFMVACKRHAEHLELGEERGTVRTTLELYPLVYLRFVWMMSAAIAVTAYCLWAFEQVDTVTGSHFPWYQLSIAPFVMALLRYGLLVESGRGGAPEDVVIEDRPIQVLVVLWLLLYSAGIYLGH